MTTASARPAPALRRLGLLAGALGWGLMLALAVSRLALAAPRDDGLLISGLAIALACLLTGATLLVLHALRAGFGALDAFFAAALARSTQRPAKPPPPEPQPDAGAPRRGFIGDRPYVVRRDGAVEVETLFGPRLFSSLADAEDFIGV